MNSHTDIIKDRLNILDVVSAYVRLEKAGKTYKGNSPFTNEKTPSFFVSPEKGFFYCFSSGKGGDIFTFIEEIERVDFKEALKILAEKAGVDLGTFDAKANSDRDILYEILDRATKFYEVQLRKNPDAVEYLKGRSISKDSMVKFRLGFAHDNWRDIYEYLKSRGYEDRLIEQTGLIIKKDGGGYYDRFRGRVMFPIMDARGRVVGYSGRIFGEAEGAKYINSPDGPLYDKSKILYGYHTAKTELSRQDRCVLVEGQFDVVLSQQTGVTETVAISGTGLTEEHIKLIKRFTDHVILALDSDNAGIKATKRSVLMGYQNGLDVKVAVLPQGDDPADLIAKSEERWGVILADAKDYLDYRLELASQDASFEDRKQLVSEELFTFVALTPSAIQQDAMLQKLALFLGVSLDAVRSDFMRFTPDEDVFVNEQGAVETVAQPIYLPQERIRDLLTWQKLENNEEIGNMDFEDRYQSLYDTTIQDDMNGVSQTEQDLMIFKLQNEFQDKESIFIIGMITDMLNQEDVRIKTQESEQMLAEIRKHEQAGEIDHAMELMKKNQTLLQTIESLKNI